MSRLGNALGPDLGRSLIRGRGQPGGTPVLASSLRQVVAPLCANLSRLWAVSACPGAGSPGITIPAFLGSWDSVQLQQPLRFPMGPSADALSLRASVYPPHPESPISQLSCMAPPSLLPFSSPQFLQDLPSFSAFHPPARKSTEGENLICFRVLMMMAI